jgi:hypothetical protein
MPSTSNRTISAVHSNRLRPDSSTLIVPFSLQKGTILNGMRAEMPALNYNGPYP